MSTSRSTLGSKPSVLSSPNFFTSTRSPERGCSATASSRLRCRFCRCAAGTSPCAALMARG
eukprot:5348906-Prymnesium_polylepis.2